MASDVTPSPAKYKLEAEAIRRKAFEAAVHPYGGWNVAIVTGELDRLIAEALAEAAKCPLESWECARDIKRLEKERDAALAEVERLRRALNCIHNLRYESSSQFLVAVGTLCERALASTSRANEGETK